jgi:hypothetical protein
MNRVNKEIHSIVADPAMRRRFADLASVPLPGTAADFGKLIVEETAMWGKVIRAASSRSEAITGRIFHKFRYRNHVRALVHVSLVSIERVHCETAEPPMSEMGQNEKVSK